MYFTYRITGITPSGAVIRKYAANERMARRLAEAIERLHAPVDVVIEGTRQIAVRGTKLQWERVGEAATV